MSNFGWKLLKILFWLGVWGVITVFFSELTGLIVVHASYIALVFTLLGYLIADHWNQ